MCVYINSLIFPGKTRRTLDISSPPSPNKLMGRGSPPGWKISLSSDEKQVTKLFVRTDRLVSLGLARAGPRASVIEILLADVGLEEIPPPRQIHRGKEICV